MEGEAAAARLVALIDGPPREARSTTGRGQRRDVAFERPPRITLDGVSVRYPDDRGDGPGPLALSGVDLAIEPGVVTALVGPTGAGKSTVVSALLRLIDPVAGRIRADGVDVCELEPEAWRRTMALVPQRPSFFAGTLLDNLRLGRPDAPLALVREAARLAQVDAVVTALPHGYETSISEAAGHLSGGERQRLALARALVTEAPVLLLDEPTSALDEATEAAITATIATLVPRRTVLLVAHRLAAVRRAAHVIVLEGGRVRAQGPPAEILSGDGLPPAASVRTGGRA
jgi:ABC-type multidrug transport system fused ATPase/permease subunit